MLLLRLHVLGGRARQVAHALDLVDGVRHVVIAPHIDGAAVQITADLDPASADVVLGVLRRLGVAPEEVAIVRLSTILPAGVHTSVAHDDRIIWADLIGEARLSSWLRLRYLLFMVCAGLIAALGVIDANTILIVGAMALSPDLLPVTAACVGVVAHRPRLALRSLMTLVAGLVVAILASAGMTVGLLWIGWLRVGFDPVEAGLGVLISIDLSSAIVATVAGVAAMLSFETRASAAVGVAISVTTIPAAAFAGVAAATGKQDQAADAVAVLVLNVVLVFFAGVTTLAIQGWALRRRHRSRSAADDAR